MHRLITRLIATLCLLLTGCGLPPIINGARFLVVVDAGSDVAQVDFPDQGSCLAARRLAGEGATRCQRTTLWSVLLVHADVDLPDRTRVDAHFQSVMHCERQDLLSTIGARVVMPCLLAASRH